MAHQQRRRIIISPKLQGRLLRDACTAPVVSLAGGAVVVAILLRMVRSEADSLDVHLPSLDDLTAAMFLFVAVCVVVIVYHGVRFSHRIAGPLYRFRVSMDEVLAGKTDLTVSLRRYDYMHETADHFNRVVEVIAARDREIARLRALVGEDQHRPPAKAAANEIVDVPR